MDDKMEYKGYLEGFPHEVVNRMLEEQERQGNKRDVSVFEYNISSPKEIGGFDWNATKEGGEFWDRVILDKDFNLFFEEYPKYNLEFPRKMLVRNDGGEAQEKLVIAYLDGVKYPYITKNNLVENSYTGYEYANEIDEDAEPAKDAIISAIDRLIDVLNKYMDKDESK